MQYNFETIQDGINYVARNKTAHAVTEFGCEVASAMNKLWLQGYDEAFSRDSAATLKDAAAVIGEILGSEGPRVKPENNTIYSIFEGVRQRLTQKIVLDAIGESEETPEK